MRGGHRAMRGVGEPGAGPSPGGGPAGCRVGADPGSVSGSTRIPGFGPVFPSIRGFCCFPSSGPVSRPVDVGGRPARSGCLPGPEPDSSRTRHRTGGRVASACRGWPVPGVPRSHARPCACRARVGLAGAVTAVVTGPVTVVVTGGGEHDQEQRPEFSSPSRPGAAGPAGARSCRARARRQAGGSRPGRSFRCRPTARPGPAQPPMPTAPAADRAGAPGRGAARP